MRRIGTPTLLGYAAAAVGIVGIVSALTPEIAARSDIVRGVLPNGVPDAARTLSLAFGLGLLWLSRGLARRKHRAWQLAVALVVASAITHLAKGLDFEEAAGSTLLLVALWRSRRDFVAPGDPESVWPLLQAASAAVALGALWLVAPADRLRDALTIALGALAVRALFLWLRPHADRSERDHHRAEELVRRYGSDSLAYFALRRDNSTFFSASGSSFLAYRVVGGTAIVAGDAIGDPAERRDLLAEFTRVAHTKAWRVAIAGAGEEALRDYAELGFKSIYLGDEAFVRPDRFSLDGRPIRKVRQSASRLAKAGYRVDVLRPAEIGADLRAELRSVSEEWRGNWPERGFTMAMDAL